MKLLELIFITMRPNRWWRAGIIFLPLFFSGNIFHFIFILKITVGFIIFCLLTGAINIIDDIMDINLDRQDPLKRTLPIASSELQVPQAEFGLGIIASGAFVSAFLLGPQFGGAALLYFFVELAYFFYLKKVVIIDALTISVESAVCLLAGSLAIFKPLSSWLLIIVFLIAFFLFLCDKRRALILSKIKEEKPTNLESYDEKLLEQLINITAPFILVSYTLYSILSPEAMKSHLIYSIPLVIYGIYRIFYFSYTVRNDTSLEKALLKDVFFLANIGLWVLMMIILTSVFPAA